MALLYGINFSPYVRKVRVFLAEKGIAYDQEPKTKPLRFEFVTRLRLGEKFLTGARKSPIMRR